MKNNRLKHFYLFITSFFASSAFASDNQPTILQISYPNRQEDLTPQNKDQTNRDVQSKEFDIAINLSDYTSQADITIICFEEELIEEELKKNLFEDILHNINLYDLNENDNKNFIHTNPLKFSSVTIEEVTNNPNYQNGTLKTLTENQKCIALNTKLEANNGKTNPKTPKNHPIITFPRIFMCLGLLGILYCYIKTCHPIFIF